MNPATMPNTLVPEPGVYPGVPSDTYHRGWLAASNSALTKLYRSPAHLKAHRDNPSEDTEALTIGKAVHTAILEPDLFDSCYSVAKQCEAETKEKKRCSNSGSSFHDALGWLCGTHSRNVPAGFDFSRVVLTATDYRMCLGVRDAVLVHSSARRLLAGTEQRELSLAWIDGETGLTCKGRLDGYAPSMGGGVILDIKTTRDASRREFEKAIFSHGYHRAGAFYLDGTAANQLPIQHFLNIAVEKEAPYAVAVYRLDEGAIDAGREQLRPLLKTYAMCDALNEWPAYPSEVQDIALPSWAWKQIDEEIMESAA